jgi:hypothetical protein
MAYTAARTARTSKGKCTFTGHRPVSQPNPIEWPVGLFLTRMSGMICFADQGVSLGFYCFELFVEAVAAQQVGQVLRESGAWHDHVAACFEGLDLEVALEVR